MPSSHGLIHGPLDRKCQHLCVDMQLMFAEPTEWHTPWMERVRPVVHRLVAAHPERTIFTCFIPPERPEDVQGSWRRYYERWSEMTRSGIAPRMLELLPELAAHVPPATVIDKGTYSPFVDPSFERRLRERGAEALIISGAETDVCVLATVLGAVDRGFRVIVPVDAICSSADETHDALMTLYASRFGRQIETARTEEVLASWT